MKIALPSNGSEVDEHFGHCQCFTIFGIDDQNRIVSTETLTPPPVVDANRASFRSWPEWEYP